jgi:hypothetical protein
LLSALFVEGCSGDLAAVVNVAAKRYLQILARVDVTANICAAAIVTAPWLF